MNEQVFISYSRKDTDWALMIKNTLESNGLLCWMDQSGINAGERYTRKIIDAIKQCSVFLLVLSENAEASEWVPKELGKAIQYHKYIIPVKISSFEVEEFELQLENIQIFELDNLSEIQAQIALVNTIKQALKLKLTDNSRGTFEKSPSRTAPAQPVRPAAPIPKKPHPPTSSNTKRNFLIGGAALLMLMVVGGSSVFLFTKIFSGDGRKSASVEMIVNESEEKDRENTGKKSSKKSAEETSKAQHSDTVSDEAVQLCSLHIMNSVNAELREDAVNSTGQVFDQAIWAMGSYSENYATFYLGGDYSRFTGVVSCPDDMPNSESYTFKVYLDDDQKHPAAEFSMSRSTPPTLLDIDTAGHDTITFWVSREARDTGFLISDGQLYESDGQVPESLPSETAASAEDTLLVSQHIMNSVNAEIREKVTNSVGQVFDEAVWAMGSYSENYATFYLGGGYSRFTGTVSCPDDMQSTESYTFMVFLDDDQKHPAAEFSMSRSTPPTLLDIDTSGHDTITFWASREARDTGFVISDGTLYTGSEPVSAPVVDTSTSAENALLTSQHIMNAVNADFQENAVNSAGQIFKEALVAIGSYSENMASFYLGRNYSRFIGTVSCPDQMSSVEDYQFMVFLDDDRKHPAAEFTMGRSTPPVLLDLDITDHDTITFWASRESRDTGFLISDGQFYGPGDEIPPAPAVDRTIVADDSMLTSHHIMKAVNASIEKKAVNSAGQIFQEALVAIGSYSENLACFYLGQNYSRFIGTVSCPDQMSTVEDYQFMVFLDDDQKHPVAEFTMSRSTPPALLDIDVTGHETITFWASRESRDTGFLISDAQLYTPGDEIPASPDVDRTVSAEDTMLTSHHIMKSINASVQEKAMNSAGQTFDEAVVAMGSYTQNLASFYLGQNYSRFTGTISCPDEMPHSESYTFKIFLDDNMEAPVTEFTMNRTMPPVPVDIDVTGHETITFWVSRESRDTGFVISDGKLIP